MTARSDDAAKAAIGAAARELRLPVVRSDAARLADSAQRAGTTYLGYLAEVLSPRSTPDQNDAGPGGSAKPTSPA
jgi:hypothetical protein